MCVVGVVVHVVIGPAAGEGGIETKIVAIGAWDGEVGGGVVGGGGGGVRVRGGVVGGGGGGVQVRGAVDAVCDAVQVGVSGVRFVRTCIVTKAACQFGDGDAGERTWRER